MKFNPLDKIPTISVLKRGLDTYTERNRIIAENIANVETKGYRPYKIEFERQLRDSMQRSKPVGLKSDPRHLNIGNEFTNVEPRISTVNQPVNLEHEMGNLAKNQIRFEFAARKISGMYRFISSAIRGQMS